jgi:hypothetical protein
MLIIFIYLLITLHVWKSFFNFLQKIKYDTSLFIYHLMPNAIQVTPDLYLLRFMHIITKQFFI